MTVVRESTPPATTPMPVLIVHGLSWETGLIAECDERIATLLGLPVASLVGTSLEAWQSREARARLLLDDPTTTDAWGVIDAPRTLMTADGSSIDVRILSSGVRGAWTCAVITMERFVASYALLTRQTAELQTTLIDHNAMLDRMIAELGQRNQELAITTELHERLQRATTNQHVVQCAITAAAQLFPQSHGALALCRDTHVTPHGIWGKAPAPPPHAHLRQLPRTVEEILPLSLSQQHPIGGRSWTTTLLPLVCDGRILGVMHIVAPTPVIAIPERAINGIAYAIAQAFESVRLRAELEIQATRDPLTGLANRQRLRTIIENGTLLVERTILGVVIIDIDRFKHINDSYGHAVGDEALRVIAALLQAHVRTTDLVCRYGGDEIVLLLPNATRAEVLRRMERIRRAATQLALTTASGDPVTITLSMGVAYANSGTVSIPAALAQADAALYAAKDAGRNCVRVAEADTSSAEGKL